MNGWGRFGIALGVLGLMIILIGLFPAIVGIVPTAGIGIVKITVILIGFSTLITGATAFIQGVFYPGIPHNLGQQIGIRLSLTGLLISAASGYADVLGYGSNPPTLSDRPILGAYQTAGMVGGFVIAALGVLVFALAGLQIGDHEAEAEQVLDAIVTAKPADPSDVAKLSAQNELPSDPELAPAMAISPDAVINKT